jgi:hypothetical protein
MEDILGRFVAGANSEQNESGCILVRISTKILERRYISDAEQGTS